MIKDGRLVMGPKEYKEFSDYCLIAPTPMFDTLCNAFDPVFLHVFQQFASGLSDVTAIPHPLFCPDEGNTLDSPPIQVRLT